MTKVIIIGMWHVRINYNTIRIINTLLLFLFFGFLSCENGTRNTIRLNPGFQAQQGCTFIASVLNCGNGVLYNSSVPDNTVYIETQNTNDLEQNCTVDNNGFDNGFDIVIIYPNPTTGNIDIKLNKVRDNPVSIAIYDDSGTIVLNFIKQTPSFSIDLSDINHGLYYIRISDGVKVITKQIIKIGTY